MSIPKKPKIVAKITKGHVKKSGQRNKARRTIKLDPASPENVPKMDTAPEVPGSTLFKVDNNIGGLFDKIPSSDAHVSAFAEANEIAKTNTQTGFSVMPKRQELTAAIPPLAITCTQSLLSSLSKRCWEGLFRSL